jgi:hypothetical protein
VATDSFAMNARVAKRIVVPANTVLPNDLYGEVGDAMYSPNFSKRFVSHRSEALDNL